MTKKQSIDDFAAQFGVKPKKGLRAPLATPPPKKKKKGSTNLRQKIRARHKMLGDI